MTNDGRAHSLSLSLSFSTNQSASAASTAADKDNDAAATTSTSSNRADVVRNCSRSPPPLCPLQLGSRRFPALEEHRKLLHPCGGAQAVSFSRFSQPSLTIVFPFFFGGGGGADSDWSKRGNKKNQPRPPSASLSLSHSLSPLRRSPQPTKKQFSIPLIRSVEGATTLELAPEGVAFLRSLSNIPVAPVVVMGPYRSGKSFLLNQLLGVGCDEGFGVGHTRDTQTKGVWIWGAPEEAGGGSGSGSSGSGSGSGGGGGDQKHALLFLDSEGFESTGKSDAYDDRIFALGATLASLLVYNLPEALRESDVEKLSFATQLAGSLFSSSAGSSGSKNSLEPGSMLWLIQRDFLGGASPQAALDAALSKVPNPSKDAGIAAVNKVRSSLRRIAPKSTAFGLPQPHLDRTKLCELGDEALAPSYREKRDELRELVRKLAAPKRMTTTGGGGSSGSSSAASTSAPAYIDGPALADLAERIVGALNARAIPSAGSILEHFNRDLTRTVVDSYSTRMARLSLPISEKELEKEHESASAEAVAAFEAGRFGGVGGEEEETEGKEGGNEDGKAADALRAALLKELAAAASAARDRNELASSRACSAAAERCEDALDAEQRSRLPSERRFERRLEESCSAKALARSSSSSSSSSSAAAAAASSSSSSSSASPSPSSSCVGPAAAAALARADRAVARERVRFRDSYNDRILSGLLVGALAVVAAGRFVLRSTLVEVFGWGCFAFLQLYPKSFLVSGSSMYEASW